MFGKLYGMASTHQATELNRHLYIDGRVKSDCKTLYYTVDLIHKAKMNEISYYEVSAKNHFELADKIKKIFQEKKIYILSNSQEDIEKCKRAFFKWKDITPQKYHLIFLELWCIMQLCWNERCASLLGN